MRAFCWYSRRRFEPTHEDVLNLHTGNFPRAKPPHTTHTPHRTHHPTHTYVWICARRATDRDLESFNLNAWICVRGATDRDLETKK